MSTLSFPTRISAYPQPARPGGPARPGLRTAKPGTLWASPPATGTTDFPLSSAQKLTVRQAARRLGVTLSTVYRLIENEVLEASKVGGRWVIYATSVESLLERMKNTNA